MLIAERIARVTSDEFVANAAIVDQAVAIVIDAVADFGRRDAFFGLGLGFIVANAVFVDLTIAIVVDAIADFFARDALGFADVVFVDQAVAIVVDAVADFFTRDAADVSFVDLTVAVVIDAVADFDLSRARFDERPTDSERRIVLRIGPAA